jgi:glutaredoxin 1/glutaredoxin 3
MYTIISRSQCNFCDRAKTVLIQQGLPYKEFKVDDLSNKWLLTLIKQAGYTTVPQIFGMDGKHIGGYTELEASLKG